MVIKSKTSGVRFETMMPERVILVPKEPEGSKTIFGVRITNDSCDPLCFLLFFMFPVFSRLDGQAMPKFGPNANRTRCPEETDFIWVSPGEQITFESTVWFSHQENDIQCLFEAENGGRWTFSEFNSGDNYLECLYENRSSKWEIHDGEQLQTVFETVWTGKVVTPSLKFQLSLQ
jgi:hypothetical protein